MVNIEDYKNLKGVVNYDKFNAALTGFVRVEGLAERVKKAERKKQMSLYRFKRRLSIPRSKMERIRNRYARFLCHRLSKYGPGEPNPHGYDNFRLLQIAIRNHNQKVDPEHSFMEK